MELHDKQNEAETLNVLPQMVGDFNICKSIFLLKIPCNSHIYIYVYMVMHHDYAYIFKRFYVIHMANTFCPACSLLLRFCLVNIFDRTIGWLELSLMIAFLALHIAT